MKSKANCLRATITMAAVLFAMFTRADILYSTVGPGDAFNSTSGLSVDGSDHSNQVIASSFTISSTAILTNAMLGLNHFAGGNNPVSVFLESDAAGEPGVILDTLTQVGTLPPFSTESLTMFTSGSNLILTPGVTYWLVAVETDPGSAQTWCHAYNNTIAHTAFNLMGSATGPWFTGDSGDVAYKINGTIVPEPSSLLLLGAGLLGVTIKRVTRANGSKKSIPVGCNGPSCRLIL